MLIGCGLMLGCWGKATGQVASRPHTPLSLIGDLEKASFLSANMEALQSISAVHLISVAGFATAVAIILGIVYSVRKWKSVTDSQTNQAQLLNEDQHAKPEDCEQERGDAEGKESEETATDETTKWPSGEPVKNMEPRSPNWDPIDYCSHIPREVRKTQQRLAMEDIQKGMDEQDREKEREVQRQQLQAIFSMMSTQQDKFGMNSMDDIQDQMKLYSM